VRPFGSAIKQHRISDASAHLMKTRTHESSSGRLISFHPYLHPIPTHFNDPSAYRPRGAAYVFHALSFSFDSLYRFCHLLMGVCRRVVRFQRARCAAPVCRFILFLGPRNGPNALECLSSSSSSLPSSSSVGANSTIDVSDGKAEEEGERAEQRSHS
jgi:hypothetical protein